MKNKKSLIITLVLILGILGTIGTPAAAQAPGEGNNGQGNNGQGDSSGDGNFICGDEGSEGLQRVLSTVMTLLVVSAAFIGVLGGAAFTLASAARPGEDKGEYIEKRNDAVLYGGGTLVVLYLSEALISQLDSALSFGCVLPFSGE